MQLWRQGRVRRVERVNCPLEADSLVLDHLMRLGCDPAAPRECRHYVYLPEEPGARAVATSLTREGWETEVEELPGAWLVTGSTVVGLSDASIRDTRIRLEALAGDHGGEYDGWEAAAD